MAIIRSIMFFDGIHYHAKKCTMSSIFVGNHVWFWISKGLALNVIISWHIQAITCFQLSIKEISLKRQRVLISIPVEEVQWWCFWTKLRHNTNVYALSEDGWDQFELLVSSKNTDISFHFQFLWSPLEIRPLSKHSLMFPQNFVYNIFFIHFVVFDVHFSKWDQIQILNVPFVFICTFVFHVCVIFVRVVEDFTLADVLDKSFVRGPFSQSMVLNEIMFVIFQWAIIQQIWKIRVNSLIFRHQINIFFYLPGVARPFQ